MPHLFDPLTLRGVTLRNRIAVSPMCEYSATDGFADDWHLVHLGSRAVGGAGLVFTDATAVTADGRISPEDLGIWKDEHIENLARITRFVKAQGAAPGIQLAHAGRKASTRSPWVGRGVSPISEGGWTPIHAPSALAFDSHNAVPEALNAAGIESILNAFMRGAERALEAGFEVVEIHGAHGYLLHEFLSPISNKRDDAYGGDFTGRTRMLCETVDRVRKVWPERLPLVVRLSCTDWVPDGWTIDDTVALSRELKTRGVDLIDCSSGGNVPKADIPVGPGYQTPFAARVKAESGIASGAVGVITDPAQADHIIRTGQADMVLLARELLRDPYWPLHAATALKHDVVWPKQYDRAKG